MPRRAPRVCVVLALVPFALGGCFGPLPDAPDAATDAPADLGQALDKPLDDIAPTDTGSTDAGTAPTDTVSADAGTAPTDTGGADTGPAPIDAAMPDAGMDAGPQDAGPPCPAGEARCGGVCLDTRSNAEHCGRCGVVCAAGQRCVAGACVCPMGTVPCGALCVTPQTDPNHCGGCRRQCPNRPNVTQRCVDATCVSACATGFADCNSDPDDGCEVDPRSNVLHCGACGRRCDIVNGLARCQAGNCTVGGCNAGFGDCDVVASNGCETNLQTDARHCGACGNACAPGLVCAGGACVSQCVAPNSFCGVQGVCTSTQRDPFNCGSCGNVCPAAPGSVAFCESGRCQQRCAEGLRGCDGRCVDVLTDGANCGGCGITCRRACAAGSCPATTVCPPLTEFCTRLGRCVSLANDPDACGECSVQCPAENTCVAGRCAPCGGVGQPCCRDGRCAAGGRCAGAPPSCVAL